MGKRFGLALLSLVIAAVVFHPTSGSAQTRVISKKEPPVIQIVKRDASILTISPDSVGICGRNVALELGNGQSVEYPKMKVLEVVSFPGKGVKLRLTLRRGGDPIEFTLDCDDANITGQNDLGDVNVALRQVNRIVFP
jgi:hypothetical protein